MSSDRANGDDGIFPPLSGCGSLRRMSKIDRSMSIVAETGQISNRGNFSLKSEAKVSDGLGGGP
jgi:hypothetical protein